MENQKSFMIFRFSAFLCSMRVFLPQLEKLYIVKRIVFGESKLWGTVGTIHELSLWFSIHIEFQ